MTHTLVSAINEGLEEALAEDDDVLLLGEDIGENGGVFRATEGLYEEFGDQRLIDTPLAESGIIGTSIGLASNGKKPVPEIQFMGFVYPGFDQIVSHAARIRTRTQGDLSCPMVVRMPYGGGIDAPEHHSESKEALFAHQPGLKVVIPSTPTDAKFLLKESIQHEDPVVFLEPKQIYRSEKEEVPDEYDCEIGQANVRRTGTDVSVFTWGAMRPVVEAVAENLSPEVSVEVVDIRTISPLDTDTIIDSFETTGRAVIVHEAPKSGGVAGEIATRIQEEALGYQKAPIKRVTGPDVPVPLAELEEDYLPSEDDIENAIMEAVNYQF